jgi:uncharacterized membrane protein YfcA
MYESVLLAAAAFGAGILNAIAGGGSFLTFPALILVGVPDVSANATSAVAVCPGYLGAAAGFRDEILKFDRHRLVKILALTAVGGLIGSLLLLVSSSRAFALVVPFLLALATLAFAFGPQARRWLSAHRSEGSGGTIGVLIVAIYGGYFNGGLGIILLALFSFWGMRDLNQMNGLKNIASLLISVISVATFAVSGLVAWKPALLMMVAATAGGYAGAPLARVLPAAVVRGIVVLVGAVLSVVFLIRALHPAS